MIDYEFYETPAAFTQWLFRRVPIHGRIFEPCVGDGAILRAVADLPCAAPLRWVTNDLDPRWRADSHEDARTAAPFERALAGGPVDWVVSNPPFTPALEIIEQALTVARVGVAMHLRASIHEVLKTGHRRTWMVEHLPTATLWLPRFAYQRSKKTGEWATDSVCACWVIWEKGDAAQYIDYAPTWVLDALTAETPEYRARMDRLMAERAAA